MDKESFIDTGIPQTLHFEPSLLQSPIPTWRTLTSAQELNCSSEQASNCFLNLNWEKSTDQFAQFESGLSSMVSSPAASNSAVSSDGFAIRELIGKLGSIRNSPSLLPASAAAASYIGCGNNSTNTSCYSTPLNSPPKLHMPIIDHFVKENLPNLGNSMPLNSALPVVSADPGFAERAAKFSCFGSRSFNVRTTQFGLNNTEFQYRSSTPLLSRVSSSPSFKAVGSPMDLQENKNSALTEMEMRSVNGSVSVSNKKASNSNEKSTVSEQIPCGETEFKSPNDLNSRKRKAVSRGKVKEVASSQSANASKVAEADDDSKAKRSKPTEGSGNENGGVTTVQGKKESINGAADDGQTQANTSSKPPEPPKDYIHVRARRGQATDSHSLAERVRREKISERMKLLQDLVPGCNKVIGKALMLDEIINYVQSLQRQVEFLSMKLASVNPRLDFDMDSLLSKDKFQPNGTLLQPICPLESTGSAFYGHQPQQNPQVHAHISNVAMSQCWVNPLDATLCHNLGVQSPPVDGLGARLHQFPTFCEDDLQSIVHNGFWENPNRNTS